jgi:IclR family pca regulon transcriptional regulator
MDRAALVERVIADREQGFSIVDEELERGLRTLAVPVVSRAGAAIGAINLVARAGQTTRNEMRDRFLPPLQETAARIAEGLA